MNEAIDKARLCLNIIKERKAQDPVLFDVSELTSFTDYFLITSGSSTRQVQAIARYLVREMRKAGFKASGVEGETEGHWILIDFGDIITHIFYQPFREFYDLEGLWFEAPRITPEEISQQEDSPVEEEKTR
jgi:ribosome-associated protein